MPVETFNYIDSLNSSNPGSSDDCVQGDDHIRGIKAVLKSTFPNITAAITATAAQINQLATGTFAFADGLLATPAISFVSEATLGFYRSAAGIISFAGLLRGNGAIPVGMLGDFLVTSVPNGWLRLNGQAVSRVTYADLFGLIGTSYGAGNGTTTFTLPDLETVGFFRRSGASPGVTQAELIKSHTASVAGSTVDHGHTLNQSAHNHQVGVYVPGLTNARDGGGSPALWTGGGATTAITSLETISISVNNAGALGLSGTATYSGGAETRPVNIQVVTCIKA